MKFFLTWTVLLAALMVSGQQTTDQFVRINQLGYLPAGSKVAVWGALRDAVITEFELLDAANGKVMFRGRAGKPFGTYGPFTQTYRLNFSAFRGTGNFKLRAGNAVSPSFPINDQVYSGSADFCMRYMRQQRSGFNPFLKDSCHTHDGYTMYGPMPDSTHVDVSGGWHDASDYLQYVTTSANATYHLLMAYRDFPAVFGDAHLANGLEGTNGRADVLDEAKWGLDWLLKMHPRSDWMFNQLADDRDHISMRMPSLDSQYGKGYERPVYFVTGQPQGLGKHKNRTTGKASTAGKFASAFTLGYSLLNKYDPDYGSTLLDRAGSALKIGISAPGVCQTAPMKAPYFYEEDNWADDMELAFAAAYRLQTGNKPAMLDSAMRYARMETTTPWLGKDTARHYQWYPFINLGHRELAVTAPAKEKSELVGYYKKGIEAVWNKARQNAFYRGVPFIWCSNNLTTSFAIQCKWYRGLTGDKSYVELEQANIDWLFGCNPWGTSMVYGLPANGDTPLDPHSAFTHLKKYPIDGGLVDGPVYTSISRSLIGLTLYEPDEYAPFQSDLATYHDDYGDYSTNEPTMDGTASLVYLLAACESESGAARAITRGDAASRRIAIVFTGHEYANGGSAIREALNESGTKASFFLTGDFYSNARNRSLIAGLKNDGHYLGAHSNKHLLYCDWKNRDSLLVTKSRFLLDFRENEKAMAKHGIDVAKTKYFLPPYEWYNDSIVKWTGSLGKQLINYTPGTLSHADYTAPQDANYRDNATILESIRSKEQKDGLNGYILLFHIGATSKRDKPFFNEIKNVIFQLKERGYQLVRIDDLL
jgi:peptidoglycan/xylan/chitin deacetylase (PgdA/CDA1 family)